MLGSIPHLERHVAPAISQLTGLGHLFGHVSQFFGVRLGTHLLICLQLSQTPLLFFRSSYNGLDLRVLEGHFFLLRFRKLQK